MPDETQLLVKDKLTKCGAIEKGNFVLTSGKRSDYYVDIKRCITDPGVLGFLSSILVRHVHGDVIAGVELGAVPLLVGVSILSGKRYIIVRKERDHGTNSLLIGDPREKVTIIEDVVTTGGSVLRAAKLLRENGATVDECVCVVDREEGGAELLSENGIKLRALISSSLIRS